MNKTLSTSQVARLLGVAVGSVANWIDQDQLKAGKTPGGHRRVRVEDLLEFLRQQNLPIPAELLPKQPRVLIVDDEAAVTRWIMTELRAERPDWDVLEAHDGFAAGQIVAASPPDVVVLDLRMPGLDGFEVCRRIRSQAKTRHIGVIAMTAYHSPEAEQKILQCGARACLAKPLDAAALLGQIQAAMGRDVSAPAATSQGKVNRRAGNCDPKSPDQSPPAIAHP